MENNQSGKLIIIGGGEDKEHEREILSEVARSVGDGKLCIVSVASKVGDELWDVYKRTFRSLGVQHLSHLDVVHRREGIDHKALDAVKDAKGIFFTGGDQLKITSELGGTQVLEAIIDVFNKGGVIAGTSAGASVMSETMMIAGQADASFRIGTGLSMAPGLGLTSCVIIDQHFAERGRIGRLLGATALNPRNMGIGIDENTAIVFDDQRFFRVIGSGAVYVLDAHEAHGNNISEGETNTPLSIFDVKMHVLVKGDSFDIKKRLPSKGTNG